MLLARPKNNKKCKTQSYTAQTCLQTSLNGEQKYSLGTGNCMQLWENLSVWMTQCSTSFLTSFATMARFKATWLVPQKDSVARWHIARRWRTEAFTKTCWQEVIWWFLIHDTSIMMILIWFNMIYTILSFESFGFDFVSKEVHSAFHPFRCLLISPFSMYWHQYKIDCSSLSGPPGPAANFSRRENWPKRGRHLGRMVLGVTLPRQFHKLSKIKVVYTAIQHRLAKNTQKRARLVLYLLCKESESNGVWWCFHATGSPELGEAASKVCSIDSACHRRWAWMS